MIEFVREGDIVVVHSIDRLARNLADLEKLIAQLTEKGVPSLLGITLVLGTLLWL